MFPYASLPQSGRRWVRQPATQRCTQKPATRVRSVCGALVESQKSIITVHEQHAKLLHESVAALQTELKICRNQARDLDLVVPAGTFNRGGRRFLAVIIIC